MKRFIIADGIIQSVLAIGIITGMLVVYLSGSGHDSSILYSIYVLLGWQLASSLIHVAERRKLLLHKWFYYLQLMLLGYCLFIGVTLVATRWVVFPDVLADILAYLFFGGMLTLLPALMLSIAFFSTRRMFMLLR
ncbi:hypothetical protein ACTJJ0_16405 [Chitinophaga sp. 22321]|uniref:Uncharacterized protein n=1 Tax=Chitinophaga hostae TaxID=2831022 RepID=A0ABS5J452_9BACT|nr:hypothetical protein [Chitinophaga hostae]MBS0029342.1 hypothetical protein [Chitinophaga hostae]